MSVFHSILNSCQRAKRLFIFVIMAVAIACAVMPHAMAQEEGLSPESTPAAPPYAEFQYSTLTGSGDTITATRLPVVTSSGITYYNITLFFDVDSSGNLTLAAGYPHVIKSPTPVVSNFLAGKYVGPSTIYSGDMMITVSGPGVTSGGATEWTLAAVTGASGCTYPSSATWYVGPLTSNPLYARIKAAGITSTAWSYGVGAGVCGGDWYPDSLMGLSQVGKSITIVSFTDNQGKDHSEPLDQVTYTPSQ